DQIASIEVVQAIGGRHDLDGMAAGQVGAVLQLPAAGLGVARRVGDGVALGRPEVEEVGAYVHGELVLPDLVAVGAGEAAATSGRFGNLQAGDERHDLQRRFADAVGAHLAGRVVGQLEIDCAEARAQVAGL